MEVDGQFDTDLISYARNCLVIQKLVIHLSLLYLIMPEIVPKFSQF